MKKIQLNNIRLLRKKNNADKPVSRITNETVVEHREQILAGGRRFKYPVQYAKHKLVANAIIITLVALVLLVALGLQQLYVAQNSSDFMYRITQLFPVPVATIANEPVRYSDYLVYYRGSEYYLSKYGEVRLNTEDGKRQLEGIKRQALDKAEADAYAAKLARDKGITVTNADIDAVVNGQRNTANGQISQEAYDASSLLMYGWSTADYRQAVSRSILRAKVAFAVDDQAKAQSDKALGLVKSGKSLQDTAKELGGGITVQSPGLIASTSSFNGLAVSDVAKLESGATSGVMKSVTDDGYYIVHVTQKTDTQVNFEFIKIPLSAFSSKVADIKKTNQIHEFINVAK